jgi:hypothetical protein
MPKTIESQTEWLLNNLEQHIEQTSAEVLIIDQLDRVQLPIGKRTDFLFKLKALTRKYKLSTMLVLNTRPRNFSRPVELQHIQNSQLYVPFADSVIAIAADYYYDMERYLKPLKMRNRIMSHSADVECFMVYVDGIAGDVGFETERTPPSAFGGHPLLAGDLFHSKKLSLSFTATRPEGELLKKSKTALKQEQIMRAEAMRKDGMSYEYIADAMQVPITTAKRWVSCVKGSPTPNPSPKERGFNFEEEGSVVHMMPRREEETTPSPKERGFNFEEEGSVNAPLNVYLPGLKATPDDTIGTLSPPTLGGEFLITEKPDGLSEEEWAVCVNNPASVFFDEFAYNPFLVEREMSELGLKDERIGRI